MYSQRFGTMHAGRPTGPRGPGELSIYTHLISELFINNPHKQLQLLL